MMLLRDADTTIGADLALTTPAEELIGRYADRWSIEVTLRENRQDLGTGQAENRVLPAVERTVPFGLFTYTIIWLWYALHGHRPEDVTDRRSAAPWYTSKSEPSFTDALAKLRRTIIAHRNKPDFPAQPTLTEIRAVTNAWAAACA